MRKILVWTPVIGIFIANEKDIKKLWLQKFFSFYQSIFSMLIMTIIYFYVL